ncbi:hypothetical protein Pth03_80580 [Planotetraspora thailandica]|uniref:Uncharacterized protein n=1 Tax=Planotetraspora thailandica TaxID=487172 RepID=A0A8J4DF58_9ACTN|nr:hypothetical protein Pth03_80580 [Planotetraspora thailandica]
MPQMASDLRGRYWDRTSDLFGVNLVSWFDQSQPVGAVVIKAQLEWGLTTPDYAEKFPFVTQGPGSNQGQMIMELINGLLAKATRR